MAGGAGDGDGVEDDDPLAVGSYSQLLFSDEVDDISTDDCFNFTSSFSSDINSPKMLCFGGEYLEELSDLGFDVDDDNYNYKSSNNNNNGGRNAAPIAGVAASVTCSDSSSTSSTNNGGDVMAKCCLPKSNKKRNVSGLSGSDEQIQKKNQNSVDASGNNNANEIIIKAPPVMMKTQRNFKKTKSGTISSETSGHAKVKKEKLGERILALQQLVSPFGKSDTASVLHEAMGYIRFLHDQVQVLCSPYLQRLPSSAHLQYQEGGENGEGGGDQEKEEEEESMKKNLSSKGLCLVPLELTLHVADNNGADFWSPAMGSVSVSSKP